MLREAVERLLLKGGFTHPEGRVLLRDQIVMCLVTGLAALVLSGLAPWGFGFAGGTLLITVNFWWMVRFAQSLLSDTAGAVGGAFFRFFIRLGITGVALYAMIVEAGWPVWAILLGTSTVLVTILVWGALKRAGSNSAKEA